MEGLPKKEKGLKAAAWLMQVAGKKYLHVSKEVSATESLKKGNKWESEKQMLDKFDWDEFQAHIGSGRVTYREDPSHTWSMEMELGEEEGNQFNHLCYQDAMGLGLEDIAGKDQWLWKRPRKRGREKQTEGQKGAAGPGGWGSKGERTTHFEKG